MNLELLRDSARSICRNDGKLTARARYDDEHIFGRRSVSRLVQLRTRNDEHIFGRRSVSRLVQLRTRNRLQVSGIIQIMVGHSFHDRYRTECVCVCVPLTGDLACWVL